MKKLMQFTVILLAILSCSVIANNSLQDVAKNTQMTGNTSEHMVNWQAKWIWGSKDSKMQLFRRSFEISDEVVHANLQITASSLYQVYINGNYLARGPARSAPHHQSYDTWQIASLLKPGNNIIAIKVHFQDQLPSYQHMTRAGLLAQLDVQLADQKFTIASDEQWLTLKDQRWNINSPKMSRFHQQVNDLVELNKQLTNWQSIKFNDENWLPSQVLMRNVGWPSPGKNAKASALTPPWTQLVARDIPNLKEEKVKATNLIFAGKIEHYLHQQATFPKNLKKIPEVSLNQSIEPSIAAQLSSWQQGEVITLPKADKPWLLVFDYGQVRNGMPYFNIQGSMHTKVEVISKPFMLNQSFSYHTIDSNLIDQIHLSGDEDKWQATYFKPARYLGLIVSSQKQAVSIQDFGINEISYPFVSKGNISSEQAPWLNKFMVATEKTIKAATTDAFTDNYRERRQYAQTGFYAALGNYYLFADPYLQKRYLLQVAQEQYANGLMPAYAPQMGNSVMVILDSNLLWLSSIHHYLLYTGDVETVTSLLPTADKLLALLSNYINQDGLIDEPPFAYWLDHAKNDRRGANLNLNGHYLHALENYAQVLDWLNVSGSDKYRLQSQAIRKAIKTKFWHQEKGLFVDALVQGKQSTQFSEHGNAMALALNIATDKQASSVIKQLLKNDNNNQITRFNDMTVVTPAMSYYLHKGLANYGYIDESFALLNQRFAHMFSPQYNGTLWEEWWLNGTGRSGEFIDNGRTRSDAQTESAFAPALFAEYIVGVKPTEAGMSKIKLFNRQHSITDVIAKIPTPYGELNIAWLVGEGKKQLKLTIPEGVQIELDSASFSGSSYAGTTLDAGVYQLSLDHIGN